MPCGAVPPVEADREQNVSRLGAAIGDKGRVLGVLEVGVDQIDVRKAVAGRSEINQPAAGVEQGGDPIDEKEVSQVIGPELRLKAVDRVPEGRRHDSGVGDDHIEVFTRVQQPVRSGPHAGEAGEIELDQFEATAARGCVPLALVRWRVRLW